MDQNQEQTGQIFFHGQSFRNKDNIEKQWVAVRSSSLNIRAALKTKHMNKPSEFPDANDLNN